MDLTIRNTSVSVGKMGAEEGRHGPVSAISNAIYHIAAAQKVNAIL